MAYRLTVINKLRPKLIGQGMVDLKKISQRMSKNTTYNAEEISSILGLFTKEANAALQAGETVKINDLVNIKANLKVGGRVDLTVRSDRGAIAGLNNPRLWTADKVANHANLSKSSEELVAQWNADHPEDPVAE